MKSSVVKRSIVIDGHKTSVSLEDAFWSGLKESRGPKRDAVGDGCKDRPAPTRQPVLSDPPVRA